jgi:hypothetical protein
MDAMTSTAEAPVGTAARSDAGAVRLTGRDIRALMWCGEMYGIRADLLASLLGVSSDVVRQLHMRWRRAGLAETARLGPGPVWCWLSRAGLEACGLPYAAYRPPLGRLAHVHAVGSVRAALESWGEYVGAGAFWRPERRLRWRLGARPGRRGHVPDGEVHWPELAPYFGGEIWCVEVELTPKPVTRIAGIMTAMLNRRGDYSPDGDTGRPAEVRYARLLYACARKARPTVERALDTLPPAAQARIDVRDLPDGAVL